MFGRLFGFLAAEIFSSNCSNCRSASSWVSDVGPDHFLVPANGRDKVTARPEFVAQKIAHLAFDVLRYPYRTLPLHVSDDLRHRIFGRYRDQHMNVIRHQMSLLDPALLPSCQIVKHLTQMPFYLAEKQLLAILRREHDVVLALPGRVIKMIELCFHHGLLEGSWRFPQGDLMTSFPKL